MLAAYAYSLFKKAVICPKLSFGGMTSVTIEVPLLNKNKTRIKHLPLAGIKFLDDSLDLPHFNVFIVNVVCVYVLHSDLF